MIQLRSLALSLVLICLLGIIWGCGNAKSNELQVVVASNFLTTAERLVKQFESEFGIEVSLISGSTGKLYAQIENGAPFDIFLAADAQRPQLLAESGLGIAESRFTYAIGELVLWSASGNFVDDAGSVLSNGNFEHLAIANPQLAPYGVAAQETLEHLGLWEALEPKLIQGENISQALQYATSGSAELGFIARSQLPEFGSHWVVPHDYYSPIEQQAIIIASTEQREDAERFMSFLGSDEARDIIETTGYRVPER